MDGGRQIAPGAIFDIVPAMARRAVAGLVAAKKTPGMGPARRECRIAQKS
jgi:hypothetical protein